MLLCRVDYIEINVFFKKGFCLFLYIFISYNYFDDVSWFSSHLDSILNCQQDEVFLQIQGLPFLDDLKGNCYRFLKVRRHHDNHMDPCSLGSGSSDHRVGGGSSGLSYATCSDCGNTGNLSDS